MPCMCGDTCCWSCGPAQGNSRCPICGAWASDDDAHFDEDGELRPEFEAEAQRIAAADVLAEREEFARAREAERDAAEYWRQLKGGKP